MYTIYLYEYVWCMYCLRVVLSLSKDEKHLRKTCARSIMVHCKSCSRARLDAISIWFPLSSSDFVNVLRVVGVCLLWGGCLCMECVERQKSGTRNVWERCARSVFGIVSYCMLLCVYICLIFSKRAQNMSS